MELLFVDTSALYALADRDDRHHAEALAIVDRVKAEGVVPFVSDYIVAEAHVLVLSRLGAHVARKWLAGFAMPVQQVTEEDQASAKAIVLNHRDKDYSLTEATSFSVMKQMGVKRAFAFDAHFAQFGFEVEEATPQGLPHTTA